MLPAKPAAAPTPSSTRVRTVCTSLLATLADPVVPSPPSRLVSVAKSVAASALVKLLGRVSRKTYGIDGGGNYMFCFFLLVCHLLRSFAVKIGETAPVLLFFCQ